MYNQGVFGIVSESDCLIITVTPEGTPAAAAAADPSPVQLQIQRLSEERKELIKGQYREKHFNAGSILLGFGVFESIGGGLNTYLRTGKLFPGPHLYAGAAEGLGVPYLSAFLDSMGTNFSHGANYATIGSTIRRQNTTIFQSGYSPISLDIQYAQFSNFKKRAHTTRRKGGVFKNLFPEEYDFSRALYTFDIGQNDLTAGYQLNMTTEQVKAYVPDVISEFTTTIKNVYALGGRAFWIHNTGPVGCLPYIMDTQVITAAQVDKHGCAAPFNDVSQYFNRKLKEAIDQLRLDLHLAAITYVDIYSVKYSLIAQSEKLGFGDPFLVCCGHGGKYNFNNAMRCGSTKNVNGTQIVIVKSCEDPSSKIIWDGIHFTEAANRWIYNQIANGAYSDPPVPLQLACHIKDDLRRFYL